MMNAQDILQKMEEIKAKNPKTYARNLAAEIGVSEGQLLAAQIGENITRLRPEMVEILENLEPLGKLMALTRNEYCVNERKGIYKDGKFFKNGKMTMGLFVDQDGIDLRLIMMHWKHVFAVEDPIKGNSSLQFFNKAGEALHKIYLTDASDKEEYHALVKRFTSEDQTPGISVEDMAPAPENKDGSDVNWEKLRTEWEKLKDVHDFHSMLRKFKVGREQAFRRVGSDFAFEVDNVSSRMVLELAKEKECPLMAFVGNKGCIGISTAIPNNLVEHGSWFNILDPDYNLHLNEDGIARSWVTRKPTKDGIVTSLEVVDGEGNIIITFYGQRLEGQNERTAWREIIDALPKKNMADAAE
ncbi:MAG: hemin-degrading factor [Methylocystaceae bacterium]|nr:hemin-degrading factor [Methylocystaceae bacterium]